MLLLGWKLWSMACKYEYFNVDGAVGDLLGVVP